PGGELKKRLELNMKRLEQPDYHFDFACKQTPQAPGDYLGRTLLARTLLWRALKEKPEHIGELAQRLPEVFNSLGYVGEIMPDTIKELVIGGHNGMLRGLCEYYTLTGDGDIFGLIETILENLIVPFCDKIDTYPDIDPEMMLDGEQVALVWGETGGWELSTDIGTIYLTLDGISHAYRLKPSPRLKSVIEKMIRQYAATDLLKINAQTHSSLSALRGILRFYESTGYENKSYIELAERVFDLYTENAETENYANYNWFERPEWTEPCAIVDAFTVAVWLWKLTGTTKYLRHSHLILYNALLRGQRPTGGFGCDTCVGANGQLEISEHTYEAKWCCNMRGAEGLARAVEFEYFTQGQRIIVPFMADNIATLGFDDGEIVICQLSGYPYEGKTQFKIILSTSAGEKEIAVFLPDWISKENLALENASGDMPYIIEGDFLVARTNISTGDIITLRFSMPLRREGPHNERAAGKYHRWFRGPLLLGRESGGELEPVCKPIDPNGAVNKIQVLFENQSD
ncbi:MAG: glycoside hydrolase family 127 protein, partial [Oscillospiraceae bacterium]|nr:glycoside hydrolase family 127 protein [Oscillospiraceae bacterium]